MSSTAAKATVGIIAVAAVTLLVLWRRPQPAATPVAAPEPPVEVRRTPPPPTAAPDASAEMMRLKARLAEEVRARQRAETEAADLRGKIAPLQSNVVVVLGKVEDMGKRAGAFLPAMGELQALSGRDPGTLSADEKRRLLELQRDHAKLLGALPEIAGFQDNPDEYGRFFSSMLQQAAGLTDAQAGQVNAYMRERAATLNQLELNTAKEPTDPKLEEAWEARRDAFNEITANGLKAILPPGAAEKAGFGPELMEFLEMDFDKLTPAAPPTKEP
jgi:hypothetical protein